jgi:hypothetical protein
VRLILFEVIRIANVRSTEYVRARVKNVHDRKNTKDHRDESQRFTVKNLSVQDYYA